MPAAPQPARSFSLNPRTSLVTLDFVRAARGVSADAVLAMVDDGKLRWVWDVSSGRGDIRAFRFLAAEVVAHESVRTLTTAAVVSLVLGSERQRWRGVELAQLLLVSRPQIFRLRKAGAIKGKIDCGTLYVQRPVLEKFLVKRLVGLNT
jgi:hypothetical protein